jgi:hypothetical protein
MVSGTPFTGRKKPAQQPIQRVPPDGLPPATDISDRRRHREDDVEVRHRQQLGLSVGQPLSKRQPLTFRLAEWFSMLVSSYRLSPIRSAAINATNAGLLRR